MPANVRKPLYFHTLWVSQRLMKDCPFVQGLVKKAIDRVALRSGRNKPEDGRARMP